jgi:rare lipoprotein A
MNTPEAHFGDFVDPNRRRSVLFKCVSGFGFRSSNFRAARSHVISPVHTGPPSERVFGVPKTSAAQKASLALLLVQALVVAAYAADAPVKGLASWYGEEHRGKLMANGKRFNPDKLTAASWFYPLGTKVRVSLAEGDGPVRSVMVTITDRGPAKELVRDGRIVDLTHAAFRRLAHPNRGLVAINVELAPNKDAEPATISAPQPTATPVPAVTSTKGNLEVSQAAPDHSTSQ